MSLYYPTVPVPSMVFVTELQFSTLISQYADGTEQRRDLWSQGKSQFTIQYNVVTRNDIERLWNFYKLCKGSKTQFYFSDPTDTILGPLLPYDQVKVWVQLHEGQGTKLDDWNGYLYQNPYTVKFAEDKLSKEQLTNDILSTGVKLIQCEPLTLINNYGTLAGGSWIQLYDGTVGINFNGSSDYVTFGDAADLDVGVGDFSLAIAVNPNSLASAIPVVTKKSTLAANTAGWALIADTDGGIDFYLSDASTQKVISSAASVLTVGTWKIIVITLDRDGNGQAYVNNVASGAPVALTGAGNADNAIACYLARQGTTYGNIILRNFLFAKKVWDSTERTKIFDNWRSIFGI